jgi:hypothetical protein
MTKQDKEFYNELLKEYTPQYKVGQKIQYNKKSYTIIEITLGIDKFGKMGLQYVMEYTYKHYNGTIITKKEYEGVKVVDNNSKLKEV